MEARTPCHAAGSGCLEAVPGPERKVFASMVRNTHPGQECWGQEESPERRWLAPDDPSCTGENTVD